MTEHTQRRSDAETEAQLLEALPLVQEKVDSLRRIADPDLAAAAENLRESLRVVLGIPQ